jgi:hypothetical protein
MVSRRTPVACSMRRRDQPGRPRRHHLMLFRWVQDVPYGPPDTHSVGHGLSLAASLGNSGLRVSLSCRLWVLTEGQGPKHGNLGGTPHESCGRRCTSRAEQSSSTLAIPHSLLGRHFATRIRAPTTCSSRAHLGGIAPHLGAPEGSPTHQCSFCRPRALMHANHTLELVRFQDDASSSQWCYAGQRPLLMRDAPSGTHSSNQMCSLTSRKSWSD